MKISEFIEKLEEFKKENGDLDIAIYREPEFRLTSSPYDFYLDIDIRKLIVGRYYDVFTEQDSEVKLEKDKVFCGLW